MSCCRVDAAPKRSMAHVVSSEGSPDQDSSAASRPCAVRLMKRAPSERSSEGDQRRKGPGRRAKLSDFKRHADSKKGNERARAHATRGASGARRARRRAR